MFFAALLLLLLGYPVAFSFGAAAMLFGFIGAVAELQPDPTLLDIMEEFFLMFSLMPFRIYSMMTNTILMAVPLFILMGIILQKSALAERLLESMGLLFGRVRGGLAVSTVLVGTLLAASTGVVGASVVAMGVISLPVMLKHGYNKPLATGTVCASGTLGQIIPPSIILIILGDVFQLPVGDLFHAALKPGLVLVGSYIAYILLLSYLKPDLAPILDHPAAEKKNFLGTGSSCYLTSFGPDNPGARFHFCRCCHPDRVRLCGCSGSHTVGGNVQKAALANPAGFLS